MRISKFIVPVLAFVAGAAVSVLLPACSTTDQQVATEITPYIEPFVKDAVSEELGNLSPATRERDAAYVEDFATVLDSIDTGAAPAPEDLAKLLTSRVSAADVQELQPIITSVVVMYDAWLYPQLKARLGSGYVYIQDLQAFTSAARAAAEPYLK